MIVMMQFIYYQGVMEKRVNKLELIELRTRSTNNQLKEENKIKEHQLKVTVCPWG